MSEKSDREIFGFGDAGELDGIIPQATEKVKEGLSAVRQLVESSQNVFFDTVNSSIDKTGSVVERSLVFYKGLGEKALSNVVSKAVQLGDRKSEE